jgi:uncharacterized protein YoxC
MIEIAVALITGGLAFLGVVVTCNKNNREIQAKLETAQAVTDCKIDELTREVREHNNFAKRMPVVEEQIKVINHRLSDLEHKEG